MNEEIEKIVAEKEHLALALELPSEVYDFYTAWLRTQLTSLAAKREAEIVTTKILWNRMSEWQKEREAENPEERRLELADVFNLIEWKIAKTEKRGFEHGVNSEDIPTLAYDNGRKAGAKAMKEKAIACIPLGKNITKNEPGTVEDYHTHGFNECRDHVIDMLRSLSLNDEV